MDAIHYGLLLIYIAQKTPLVPLTSQTPTQEERNAEIRARYARGELMADIAADLDISQQRVSQIIRGQRK